MNTDTKYKQVPKDLDPNRVHPNGDPDCVQLFKYKNGTGVNIRIGKQWYAVNLNSPGALTEINNPR